MKLLVLAGGFGTRLKEAVPHVPKALAPVGRHPFLKFQLENWVDQGVDDFVFLLHHQADLIVDFLEAQKEGLLQHCGLKCLIEPSPLDTGGAVAYAVAELVLTGNFLVTNADTWLGNGVFQLTQEEAPAIATVKIQDTARYGEVVFDEYRIVQEFSEKIALSKSGWINAGLYSLPAATFKKWNGNPFSLERDLFKALLLEKKLKAVCLETSFIDIGMPEDYLRFCKYMGLGNQNDG